MCSVNMYSSALDQHINNLIVRELKSNPHLDPVARKRQLVAEYGITEFTKKPPGAQEQLKNKTQSLPHSKNNKSKLSIAAAGASTSRSVAAPSSSAGNNNKSSDTTNKTVLNCRHHTSTTLPSSSSQKRAGGGEWDNNKWSREAIKSVAGTLSSAHWDTLRDPAATALAMSIAQWAAQDAAKAAAAAGAPESQKSSSRDTRGAKSAASTPYFSQRDSSKPGTSRSFYQQDVVRDTKSATNTPYMHREGKQRSYSQWDTPRADVKSATSTLSSGQWDSRGDVKSAASTASVVSQMHQHQQQHPTAKPPRPPKTAQQPPQPHQQHQLQPQHPTNQWNTATGDSGLKPGQTMDAFYQQQLRQYASQPPPPPAPPHQATKPSTSKQWKREPTSAANALKYQQAWDSRRNAANTLPYSQWDHREARRYAAAGAAMSAHKRAKSLHNTNTAGLCQKRHHHHHHQQQNWDARDLYKIPGIQAYAAACHKRGGGDWAARADGAQFDSRREVKSISGTLAHAHRKREGREKETCTHHHHQKRTEHHHRDINSVSGTLAHHGHSAMAWQPGHGIHAAHNLTYGQWEPPKTAAGAAAAASAPPPAPPGATQYPNQLNIQEINRVIGTIYSPNRERKDSKQKMPQTFASHQLDMQEINTILGTLSTTHRDSATSHHPPHHSSDKPKTAGSESCGIKHLDIHDLDALIGALPPGWEASLLQATTTATTTLEESNKLDIRNIPEPYDTLEAPIQSQEPQPSTSKSAKSPPGPSALSPPLPSTSGITVPDVLQIPTSTAHQGPLKPGSSAHASPSPQQSSKATSLTTTPSPRDLRHSPSRSGLPPPPPKRSDSNTGTLSSSAAPPKRSDSSNLPETHQPIPTIAATLSPSASTIVHQVQVHEEALSAEIIALTQSHQESSPRAAQTMPLGRKRREDLDNSDTKSIMSTLSFKRKPSTKSTRSAGGPVDPFGAPLDRNASRSDVIGERLLCDDESSRRSPSCYQWPRKLTDQVGASSKTKHDEQQEQQDEQQGIRQPELPDDRLLLNSSDQALLMPSTIDTLDVSATPTLNRTATASSNPSVSNKSKRRGAWKCGIGLDSWVKCIAVIDIIKGTFGLILSAYLAVSIFRLMARTPDFQDLKRRMARTEFVYIFAYGATGWGVVLSVCGMAFWNFLLILFGIFLFYAVVERSVVKLRLWYGYVVLSIGGFLASFVRLWMASVECRESYLCQAEHNDWVWTIAQISYLLSLGPTIYSLALVSELCQKIPRENHFLLSRSISRLESATM